MRITIFTIVRKQYFSKESLYDNIKDKKHNDEHMMVRLLDEISLPSLVTIVKFIYVVFIFNTRNKERKKMTVFSRRMLLHRKKLTKDTKVES